jgi:hypothetical protein
MSHHQQTLARQPRLGNGFAESEGKWVTRRLAPLLARLLSLPSAAVDLDLRVKERDGADPRVILVCQISGRTRLVATATARELGIAVAEVRDDMIRQLDGAKTRREPRNLRIRQR